MELTFRERAILVLVLRRIAAVQRRYEQGFPFEYARLWERDNAIEVERIITRENSS